VSDMPDDEIRFMVASMVSLTCTFQLHGGGVNFIIDIGGSRHDDDCSVRLWRDAGPAPGDDW
jgi:hypothetical protein